MRPCPVEVGDVLAEHAGPLPLAEDEQVIQARAADAPQEALADGVGLRGAVRCAQDLDTARCRDPRERRPERAVVIADEGARALVKRGGLAQLLGDPGVGRMARRAHMDDSPYGLFNDEEGEQWPEEHVRDREEVAGPEVRGVIAQEGRPRLAARARGARGG